MTDLLRPVDTAHRPAPRPARPRLSSAFQVLVIGAIAYTGASLLNADQLWRTAERQPFGHRRDLYLDVVGPARTASKTLHLDLPGRAVAAVRNVPHAESAVAPPPTTTPLASISFASVALPSLVRRFVAPPSPPPTGTVANQIVETRIHGVTPDVSGVEALWVPALLRVPPPLRTPIAGQPLQLWIGGDSLAIGLGNSLARLTGDQTLVAPVSDARISTGLTRPDYFDWPSELARVIGASHPDVLVVMFGANDAQPIAVGDRSYSIDAPEWQTEYRSRVDSVIAVAERGGVRLIWVGQPAMRSGALDRKMKILDSIYATESAEHPMITYLDPRSVFGPSYDAFSTSADGVSIRTRADDGVHFTNAGYDRLARAVLDKVRQQTAAPGAAPTMPSVPA